MLCKNCGTDVTEGNLFCPNCGVPVEPEVEDAYAAEEAVTETTYETQYIADETVSEDVIEPNLEDLPDSGKVLGIISLATAIASYVLYCFSWIPIVNILSSSLVLPCAVGAIITGLIGKKKSSYTGHKNTKAFVGSILGIVHTALLAVSAIITVILFIVIAIIGAAEGGGVSY